MLGGFLQASALGSEPESHDRSLHEISAMQCFPNFALLSLLLDVCRDSSPQFEC